MFSDTLRLVVVIEAFDSLDRSAPSRFDTDHAILSTYVTARALYRLPQRLAVSAILSKKHLRYSVEVSYPEISSKARAILGPRKPTSPTPVVALLCGQPLPQAASNRWNTLKEEAANGTGLLQPVLSGPPRNADIDSGWLIPKA